MNPFIMVAAACRLDLDFFVAQHHDFIARSNELVRLEGQYVDTRADGGHQPGYAVVTLPQSVKRHSRRIAGVPFNLHPHPFHETGKIPPPKHALSILPKLS